MRTLIWVPNIFLTLSYSRPFVASWWMFYFCRFFLPHWEGKKKNCWYTLSGSHAFMTWKRPRYLASRTEFYCTPTQSSLQPIISGMSRENRGERDLYIFLKSGVTTLIVKSGGKYINHFKWSRWRTRNLQTDCVKRLVNP